MPKKPTPAAVTAPRPERAVAGWNADPVFCLQCLSRECEHLESIRHLGSPLEAWLTPREMDTLRVLLKSNPPTMKEKAATLGLSHGTLKQYVCRIYRKLNWAKDECTPYRLTLWAAVNASRLGFELPKPEDFRPADAPHVQRPTR